MKKTFFLLILFSSLLFSNVNISLSHKNVKNGTTFAAILQSGKKLKQAPNLIFKNKTYQMFTINGNTKNYEVFIPVDYYSKKRKEKIQVKYFYENKLNVKDLFVNIIDGNYKKDEVIKVSKDKVTLSKKNKELTKKEYDKVYKKVYSVISPYDKTKNELFEMPMDSKITSSFGNARIYNGVTKSYHSGTDFRAKVGSEIKASNNGKIVLTMNRFYLGKVVYIDHGRGAYSYYSHLNEIQVKEGDEVKKGQIIAKSGRTGRITGPHLHYAFRLYNVTVDPLQYMNLYNKILKAYH